MKTFQRVVDTLKADLAAGMSVNAIVKKTGITHNAIGAYLEGRSEPTQASLEKIAAAYGRSVAWLRGDTDDTSHQTTDEAAIDIKSLSPAQKALWDCIQDLPDDKLEKVLSVVELFWSEVQKDDLGGS